MIKNNKIYATIAALIAQVIFGFSFVFTKTAQQFTTPMTVIANRYMVAIICFILVILFKKSKFRLNKNVWKLFIMSLFQPILYFIFESYGIKMTTSAFSSVMISLIPVVSMLSGIFVLKEFPSVFQYLFTILSVAGVTVMAYSGTVHGYVTPLGILMLFGAVLSSVAYNITSRKLSSEFSVTDRTFVMTLIGAVFFTFISLIENINNPLEIIKPFFNLSYTMSVLYLGLLSSFTAFYLLNYANTHLPVAKTTVFSNLTTVVSVIAGAVILDEKITVITIVSTLMIIIGILGVQLLKVKEKQV